jgi:hypothetical protein
MRQSEFALRVLPQIESTVCIATTSKSVMWLVYHDETSGERAAAFANEVDNEALPASPFEIRGLDNSPTLGGQHDRTSDIIPALANYGELVNENAVIIALGFGYNKCKTPPRWVGTASWKAVQDNDEPDTCRHLPQVVQTWRSPWLSKFVEGKPKQNEKFRKHSKNVTISASLINVTAVTHATKTMDATNKTNVDTAVDAVGTIAGAANAFVDELEDIGDATNVVGDVTNNTWYATNETAFYWFGNTAPRDLVSHFASNEVSLEKKRVMLICFFREVFDLDATTLFEIARSENGQALPWKNWFITSPEIMLSLAKLHTLLYSWIDARYPIKSVGCSPEYFSVPGNYFWGAMMGESQRCWGYIGEYVTIMYLTSDAELLQIDCDKIDAFHKNHSHSLTQRIDAAWEALYA